PRPEKEDRPGAERRLEGHRRRRQDVPHPASVQPARRALRNAVLVHGLQQGAARARRELPSSACDARAHLGLAEGVGKDLGLKTFLDVLDALAEAGDQKGFHFAAAGGRERSMGGRTLHREIFARGRKLLGSGLGAGDRLAIIIPEPEEFVLTFLGAVSAGIVPVPLYPLLALSKLDTYLESTA